MKAKIKILRGAALRSHVTKLLKVEPPGTPLAVALRDSLTQGFLEVIEVTDTSPVQKCTCGVEMPLGGSCPNCD